MDEWVWVLCECLLGFVKVDAGVEMERENIGERVGWVKNFTRRVWGRWVRE